MSDFERIGDVSPFIEPDVSLAIQWSTAAPSEVASIRGVLAAPKGLGFATRITLGDRSLSSALRKEATFSFPQSQLREATIQTNEKPCEGPYSGPVQILQAWEVNIHFTRKRLLILGLTGSARHLFV